MLKSHEKFHSTNGKRLVLVADDEMINREMLGVVLENDYEVIFAEDGLQALELIREHKDVLSLILLDLLMPRMSGRELLKTLKAEQELKDIPVIVLTADSEAEIETFALGAIDFIPKPYPPRGVILARIFRTIELAEDRQIINTTERDPLTGLYSKDYFFSYANQFDQHHAGKEMDAIVIDVNHFHMLNERYGRAFGDEVLRLIGQRIREKVHDDDGIVCRREGDTFLLYCPHREDYEEILAHTSASMPLEANTGNSRILLRMGIYANADKTIDIERRFDRAKQAADTIRNNYTKTIAIYDSTLHETELYAERLAVDFDTAINEQQFQVFYQPKFDIRGEIPILASAEALVRWQHPELGMINPGIFIPLFEENGMIRRLDHYVWQAAAAQVQEWKERFGITVPVSVNVSRADMYDEELVNIFRGILLDYDLDAREFFLEITESAYTEDSEMIVATINELRDLGFRIEMDDFGTGYSSLSMISSLPIDALKIDMVFVRNAFGEQKDVRMLELILDIAGYLHVPVVAEGVESKEQMLALKAMGCDIVQGFYFSKPIPAPEFEHFVEEKVRRIDIHDEVSEEIRKRSAEANVTYAKLAQALAQDFFTVFYINTEDDHYMEYTVTGDDRRLQVASTGTDFGHQALVDILSKTHGDDRARVRETVTKERLLGELESDGVFSITFQMITGEGPLHVGLKSMKLPGDDTHVVIGLRNIEKQFRRDQEFREAREQSVTYSRVVQALAAEYFSIFYVDMDTDRYQEFSSSADYKKLGIDSEGDDFFNRSLANTKKYIHPDDEELFEEAFKKENIVRQLDRYGDFTLTYRLIIRDMPTYFNMKVIRMDEEDSHVVIGISNIDRQIHQEEEFERAQADSMTYSSIAKALSRDYFGIFLVDTDTDDYVEYSLHPDYKGLEIDRTGKDFFRETRDNIMKVIHPDDIDLALSIWNKEVLLPQLNGGRTFTVTYRIMLDGVPVHINFKVLKLAEGEGDERIVVAISNVDDQIKREMELDNFRKKINTDSLTGVKSKHIFDETEKKWNERMKSSRPFDFAVVVCDINGLKNINDTHGHKAGDKYIVEASSLICSTFKRSPVFRIGGDEFVAILEGYDYENRQEMLDQIAAENSVHNQFGGVIVACGCACRTDEDESFEDVFAKADKAMRQNKNYLKELGY